MMTEQEGRNNMRTETPQEAAFRDMLPHYLADMAQVDMKYQSYLHIADQHLHTLYGPRADIIKRMEQYRESQVYRDGCRIVTQCDDMPLIAKDDIFRMVQADEHYLEVVNHFLDLCKENAPHSGEFTPSDVARTMELAQILGITPEYNQDALYQWIIDRRNMSDIDKHNLNKKLSENLNLVSLIATSLAKTFVPGMLQTFPIVGTVMTQQKGRYYYRGENAFYGSSKPGIFRGINPKFPNYIEQMIRHMKMDEACMFLDNFEAVRQWGQSSVNYIALVQHYGIRTYMIDITSDIKTALFFACCRYDSKQRKWYPLSTEDFAQKNSRGDVAALGGDSRYGVLYCSPMELMDCKWLTQGADALQHNIIPVGYQPFMRCSTQHGYMLMKMDPKYDMMKDSWFHKYRFQLDEDLCRWIYAEMAQGDKIYPHNDIPEMEAHMEKIKASKTVSQDSFDVFVKKYNLTERERASFVQALAKSGYAVVRGNNSYITANHLAKINRKYGIQEALKRTEGLPVMSPMIQLSPSTPVKQKENGMYELVEPVDGIE